MQLREQIDRYNMRMREFNEKQRQYRGQQERTPDQDLEVSSNPSNIIIQWETVNLRKIKKLFSRIKPFYTTNLVKIASILVKSLLAF